MGKIHFDGLAISVRIKPVVEETEVRLVTTKEQALSIAAKFCLQNEVKYCIEELHMSPEEALREWDI